MDNKSKLIIKRKTPKTKIKYLFISSYLLVMIGISVVTITVMLMKINNK